MPTIKCLLMGAACIFLLPACSGEEKQEPKPLVYEGMSSQDLKKSIGSPLKIDSSGEVYSIKLKRKIQVEKWEYEKRTVLIINDTVKDSNIN